MSVAGATGVLESIQDGPRAKAASTRRRKVRLLPYALLAPSLVFLALFTYLPIVRVLVDSLFDKPHGTGAAEAGDEGGAREARRCHGDGPHGVGERGHRVGLAAVARDVDGHPVGSGALEHRAAEGEDADQDEHAREEPVPLLGALLRGVLAVVVPPATEDEEGAAHRHERGEPEVHDERQAEGGRTGSERRTDERADAPAGVVARHEVASGGAVDVRPLDVHRDVPRAEPGAEDEQQRPERDRARRDGEQQEQHAGAEGRDDLDAAAAPAPGALMHVVSAALLMLFVRRIEPVRLKPRAGPVRQARTAG